jgi:hypothetical protein
MINKSLIVLFILMSLLSRSAFSQSENLINVVIQIPLFSEEKVLPSIVNYCEAHPELKIEGYCPQLEIIAFKVDAKTYYDEKLYSELLKGLHLELNIKDNSTLDELIRACGNRYKSVHQ